MNNDFMEMVKDVFENPENMEPDQVRRLITETNNYFASLQQAMESGNTETKDEALAAAIELKQYLESKMTVFAPYLGREPTEEEAAIIAEINEGIKARGKGKPHKLKPTNMS